MMRLDPDFLNTTGSFNRMPQPYHEITWHDFYAYVSIHGFVQPEMRQVKVKGKKRFVPVAIFKYKDRWLGIRMPTKARHGKKGEPHTVYEDLPKYYHIGCTHEWVELPQDYCAENGIDHPGDGHVVEICPECESMQTRRET